MLTVEEALGTYKGKDESWADVFARINKTRGLDTKTLARVIICILEELYGEKGTHVYKETVEILEGTSEIKEEIPSGTTADNDPKTDPGA